MMSAWFVIGESLDADLHPTSGPALTKGQDFIPELDAFRGIAILSVLCLHWVPAGWWVNRVQNQLSNGVHLFFVLSGFLITRGLLQSREAIDQKIEGIGWAARHFYSRRALRICPVYYLVLAVVACLHLGGPASSFAWHATFLSNVYSYVHNGRFEGAASVFWTLAVEEQFYLFWPLAILLLPRRAMVPFIVATAVVGGAFRAVAIRHSPWAEMLTPAAAIFLATGALMATVDHPTYGSPSVARRTRLAMALVAVVLVAAEAALLVVHGPTYMARAAAVRVFGQPLMAIAYALLFARAARGFPSPIRALLCWRPLTFLGRISYGVYLYHLVVALLWERITHARLELPGGQPRLTAVATCFGLTIAVATASWYGFERPINNLKRRFPLVRSPRPGASAAAHAPVDAA